jgi:hypothetical protein
MDKFCYNEGVDIQISDFVYVVKFCEENLFTMYHDIEKQYSRIDPLCFLNLLANLMMH